jgi:hypothetical protein
VLTGCRYWEVSNMKDGSIWTAVEEYVSGFKSRKSTAFYPSEASCVVNGKIVGSCLLKQYYRWIGKEVEGGSSYRTWIAAELGKGYETSFLKAYRKAGLLKGVNVPVHFTVMGLEIRGRLDGLTHNHQIIEVKSAYGKAFFYSIKNHPKPEHLCQVILYMALLGIDVAIMPYGCRDDSGSRIGFRMRKREIEDMGITVIGILARWKTLKKHLKAGTPPPKDFTMTDWNCRYCSYMNTCWDRKERDAYFNPPEDLKIIKENKK